MKAALLLEHYARIADAPDAIARLRRFVLDLAERGKVTDYSPVITEMASLGDLATFVMGQAPPGNATNSAGEGTIFVKVGEFGSLYPEEAVWTTQPLKFAQKGDVLICVVGATIGKLNLAIDCAIGRSVAAIRPSEKLNQKYLYYSLMPFTLRLREGARGTAQGVISRPDLIGIQIWCPPLPEQHRIVAKVEELMALCDQLEAARAEREAARDTFTLSTLAKLNTPDPETFGEDARFALANLAPLTTSADQIKQVRQTILNLAVRGKLVEQDAADENSRSLRERIATARAERAKAAGVRAKRPIKFSEEAEKESLPENWTFEALGNLVDPCATISYGVLVPGPDCEDGIPFVRAQDLSLTGHPPRPNKTISPEIEAPYARTRLKGGEILLCVVGSIGKLGIAPASWAGANIARAVARISPVELISSAYLLLAMRSEWVQRRFSDATRTLAQPTLNVGLIEAVPIPLPPLAEQKRIVAKVDELMTLCDQLETSLTTGEQVRSRLLESVLHHALEPA